MPDKITPRAERFPVPVGEGMSILHTQTPELAKGAAYTFDPRIALASCREPFLAYSQNFVPQNTHLLLPNKAYTLYSFIQLAKIQNVEIDPRISLGDITKTRGRLDKLFDNNLIAYLSSRVRAVKNFPGLYWVLQDQFPKDIFIFQRLYTLANDTYTVAIPEDVLGMLVAYPKETTETLPTFKIYRREDLEQEQVMKKLHEESIPEWRRKAVGRGNDVYVQLIAKNVAFARLLFPKLWESQPPLENEDWNYLLLQLKHFMQKKDWVNTAELAFSLTIIGAEKAYLDEKKQLHIELPTSTLEDLKQIPVPPVRRFG